MTVFCRDTSVSGMLLLDSGPDFKRRTCLGSQVRHSSQKRDTGNVYLNDLGGVRVARTHVLEGPYHYKYDNRLEPALTVDSGDIVTFACRECMDGQVTPDTTIEEYRQADLSRLHSMVGPVAVAGAEPGDVLAVQMLEFQHEGWGWTVIDPAFGGLLTEDFKDTYDLHIWHVDANNRAVFKPGIRVPVEPFCGNLGLAPAEPGQHSTVVPRPNGGNIDIRHLTVGSTLFLPVAVDRALFSVGDCHLAQGDGEICLTAIEAPLTVTLRFELQKGRTLAEPQLTTTGTATKQSDGMGFLVTTASGPDLYRNAQQAVRYMLDRLMAEYDLTRNEAYMLCSATGDLKIPQIVNGGQWTVSFHIPRSIFVA